MSNLSVDFSPVLRAIDHMGNVVQSELASVHTHVGQVRNEVVTAQTELAELRRNFEEYVLQAERTANIQRAETKLSGLKDDLEREFGHHNVVRRTSVGILQAFDVGNVSNRTVSQVSEELMIQTPRYWLAPAIVALAAWSRGDEENARLSVAEAFRRDARKCALFFSLVLRRQSRMDASVRWLRQYLLGMDPMNLTREFVVVLECINKGAFGPQGEALAAEKLSEWTTQLRNDPEVLDKQVEAWRAFVATQAQQLNRSEFPVLRLTCPQWPLLESLVEDASAIPVTIEWFETVQRRLDSRGDIASDVLDGILDTLVTEYDEDELPLRREIVYNEAILDESGDLDRARSQADAMQKVLNEYEDAVTLQTGAAMYPERAGVGPGTQRAAIGVSRDEAIAGVSAFTAGYRSRVLHAITITLSPSHSSYAQAMSFPGWSEQSSTPEPQAINGLVSTWQQALAAERERLRFKPKTMTIPIVIASAITLIAFFIAPPVPGLIALFASAGVITLMWRSREGKAKAALAALAAAEQQAIDESVRLYRAAIAEYLDLGGEYQALDSQEAELLHLLQTWPTAATANAITGGQR